MAEGELSALFVLPGSAPGAHLPILFRYVAAGANNLDRDEAVVLELSEGATPAMAEAGLSGLTHGGHRSRIDIVDWDRNSGYYQPGHFKRHGRHPEFIIEREIIKQEIV